MTNKNSKTENGQRRFSQEQYDMLKRCSDKKDMTEWNERRKQKPDEDVLLCSADLSRFFLKGALLHVTEVIDYKGTIVRTDELEYVDLKAKVDPKWRFNPNRIRPHRGNVYLEGSYLFAADLENASLIGAHLGGTHMTYVNLKGANMRIADLRGVRADNANLERTNLYFARLEAACFPRAIVDSSTLLWGCTVDRKTDFSSVALESARVQPATRELLRYNVRRNYWERWYGFRDWDEYPGCKRKRGVFERRAYSGIRAFWWMSDYGLSTARIIVTFFGLALVFANIYYYWGWTAPPGIVDNLFTDSNGISVHWLLVPLRTLYFSIVTMTTLGFGDMYANAHSIFGHILLSFQVILGYVLLGALVTRFAILFMAGGPAGKFADDKKDKDEK